MTTKIIEHAIYGYNVVLFQTSLWQTRPIFHRPFVTVKRTEVGAVGEDTSATACGKVHDRWVSLKGTDRMVKADPATVLLDPRHATKFARPCESCYRDGIQTQMEVDDGAR